MFTRLRTSLTKPPRLVIFMKDSWTRLIIYLLLLPLVLVVPGIIRYTIEPDMSADQYDAISDLLLSDFNLDGEMIVDGVFSTTISQTAAYDYLQISTSSAAITPYSITFLFTETDIELYMGSMLYESRTYTELGIENYTFDLQNRANLNTLTRAIEIVYNTQHFTIYIEIVSLYLIALFDFLMIVLLLAMIDYYIIPNQPFKFNLRFKLSIYASTIYVFSQLVLILIDLQALNIISIIVTYGYHIWIYRSIRIISKGVNINGANK